MMTRNTNLNSWQSGGLLFVLLVAFVLAVTLPGSAQAGTTDVVLGAASSQTPIDPGAVDKTNFSENYTYNDAPTPSLTIGGNVEAQIGAIYTPTTDCNVDTDEFGCWRDMRITIDSNGDGTLDSFDWSDSSNPWNMADGYTDYPAGYPCNQDGNCTSTEVGNNGLGTGANFPWDTFQWWWYENQGDWNTRFYEVQGALMNVWWSGRDQDWKMLPNGDYKVQVWVDEDSDGLFEAGEANKTMLIKVETATITGTVKDADGNAVEGAEVEAGSYMAWGQARTGSDGTFTVAGLQAGASYHVRVQAAGKVTAESDVELPSGETTASAGTITLSDAISITGTLKLDRNANEITDEIADQFVEFENQWGWMQNDLWVWVDAWNKAGPGWGNGQATFQVGDSSATFTINIPPPDSPTTYQLNVNAEGYASTPKEVSVGVTGGDAGTIVLTKASILSGTVQLPSAVTDWRCIDVQAIDTTDSDTRYWGWGNVDPNDMGIAEDQRGKQGTFRIDGIPAGTYTLELRVMGFAQASQEITVTQGTDLDVGTVTVSEGSKITGTLTIQGDSSNIMTFQGDSVDGALNIWIDAWSPSAGWGGTNLEVARGTDVSASFTIGGLSDGTYELHSWIGEGYELVDQDGNSPVFVTLDGNATQNLVLKPFEGIVTGTITGDGITVDLSKVIVEVKRPWDWLPPKIATVDNGGINASTGAYSVSGLGTGDYVVKAGVYDGWFNYSNEYTAGLIGYTGEGMPSANPDVGVSMQRVFVQNDELSPTTLNISLEQGYSISGTISLSTSDAPWHDFGDGTFVDGQPGDPNSRKDVNADAQLSEAISLDEDVANMPVMAMPMDMMFMGGEDPRMGTMEVSQDGNTATYTIPGLAPGAYIVMPPFSSRRISMFESSATGGDTQGFEGGENTHHWTTTTQMIVVSDEDVTGKNFVLGNGYTVTGKITLPEAQTVTEDWEQYQWVGHLELETATHQFLGHGKPLMKSLFNNTNKYEFTFNHVANGDYLVRLWSDRYVPGGAKVTVSNANASVNVTIEAGANLVGKLVDAETGEAVSSDDGVMVFCEAYPFVEGSWRETRDDDWSQSYIESDAGLQTGDTGGTEGARENKTPGKFHLTALPTGYKYVVVVETTCGGNKTGGAKNYVGRVIAGIDVPEGATGDIDVGTIKLTEGTTIKGRLTDSDGTGIPGIEIFAFPSDTHDGAAEAEGISDTQGYYTVYGVDPNVEYYDMIAAERPFMFDDWGKVVEWGEKRKYNVAPGTPDADFTLTRATATLSGTITIPEGSQFMMPFKGEGEEFPAAYILMQKKGVIYKDMLDGMEGMTGPMPSTAIEGTYTIDNIAPGTYKVIFMNYGLPSKVVDNVVIEEGSNTQDVTWNSAGYTVSGSCGLSTGGYPSTSDISGVVCMNVSDQSMIFGMLTQEADGTYSAYEVPGLADQETYQLVFYKESGFDDMPDIFPVGSTFTVDGADRADNTAIVTRNTVPILMVQAVQNTDDPEQIDIGIFSTTYLVDSSIAVVTDDAPTVESTAGELYLDPETGSGSLGTPVLSGDKRNITVAYTKDAGDSDVSLILAVHYGDDATTMLKTITFNVNTVASNGDVVNIYTPGQVKMGSGDATQIYVPAGALDTSDDGKALVTIEKTDEEPGSALALSRAARREAVGKLGVFSRAATTALPTGVTTAGDQYDFSIVAANDGATVEQTAAVTVQLQYDPDTVTDVDELNIWHLVGDTWTKETTNRIVDSVNYTISVDVTSLSPFVSALGDDSSSSSTTASAASSSSGGCFITTAAGGPAMDMHAQLLMIALGIMSALFVKRLARRMLNQA